MARLTFEKVTVQFPVYNSHNQSLRHQLVRIATGGNLSTDSHRTVTITALDRVDLDLRSGDAVGLIGHNGAGKSTLLRTMAGIYTPNAGRIQRQGRIATVLEIGAGMDPELSGHENIQRIGLLMGMRPAQIRAQTPDIEAFAELGDFMRLPVRTYSAGMTMRLMFAIATCNQPQILLVDEMFATGDQDFKIKAKNRLKGLIGNADIVVFASHDLQLMEELCSSYYRLEHGKITPSQNPLQTHTGKIS